MALIKLNGLIIGEVSMREYDIKTLEAQGFTVIIRKEEG